MRAALLFPLANLVISVCVPARLPIMAAFAPLSSPSSVPIAVAVFFTAAAVVALKFFR